VVSWRIAAHSLRSTENNTGGVRIVISKTITDLRTGNCPKLNSFQTDECVLLHNLRELHQ
jgi:hypothetical protein